MLGMCRVHRACVRAFTSRLVSLLGLIEFRFRELVIDVHRCTIEFELGFAPWTKSESERWCGRVPGLSSQDGVSTGSRSGPWPNHTRAARGC
jgi:hypothetical protein